jgi:hypothetical protein
MNMRGDGAIATGDERQQQIKADQRPGDVAQPAPSTRAGEKYRGLCSSKSIAAPQRRA